MFTHQDLLIKHPFKRYMGFNTHSYYTCDMSLNSQDWQYKQLEERNTSGKFTDSNNIVFCLLNMKI